MLARHARGTARLRAFRSTQEAVPQMSHIALVHPRRRLALGVCAGALALGVAACGGGGDSDVDPAQAVPASVPVYAQVTLRPDGDTQTNVANISKRLFGDADAGKLIQRELLDSADADTALEKDLTKWVGDAAGIFATGFSGSDLDGAAVIAVDDTDLAKDDLAKDVAHKTKRSYKDVDYYVEGTDASSAQAIVDDYYVSGSERGLKVVIDTLKGDDVDTIGDAKKYQDALAAAGNAKDPLATVYVEPQALVDALARSNGIPAATLTSARQAIAQSGTGWGAKVGVSPNAISLDFAATGVKQQTGASAPAGATTKALQALPGDAWLGIGAGAIGQRLRTGIQQGLQLASAAGQDVQAQVDVIEQQLGIDIDDDLLSWMGDAGVFAQGTSIASIGGALVVQSTNPAKTATAITKLTRLLRQVAPNLDVKPATGVAGADAGIRITDPSIPFPIFAVAGNNRFVLGIGQHAVESGLSPSTTLADSASYKQAAAALDGVEPAFFLDLAPVTTLLRGLGLQSDPDSAQLLDALAKVGSLSAGTKADGTTLREKLVLTLPE
jgi:hypothetical protein